MAALFSVEPIFSKMTSDRLKEMSWVAAETHGYYHVGIKPEAFLQEFLPWTAATSSLYKEKAPTKDRISALAEVAEFENKSKILSRLRSHFVKALDGWVISDENEKLCFASFKYPDPQSNKLNVDVGTYWQKHVPQTNVFSLHQTHHVFQATLQEDAFCHEHDEPLNLKPSRPAISPCTLSENIDSSSKQREHSEDDETGEEDSEGEESSTSSKGEEDSEGEESSTSSKGEEDSEGEESLTSSKGENRTERGCETLAKIASYAGISLSMAFRTHLFSMLITGRYARFIRWDRRGAVVTHRFDYVRHPHLLFDFYLRYGQLSETQRGFDPTISKWIGPLPEAVRDAFSHYPREAWYGGAEFTHIPKSIDVEETVDIDKEIFFRVEVMDNVLKRTESFIVPSPRFHMRYYSPFNRGTRRSLACPVPSSDNPSGPLDMCFIKESWQDLSLRSAPEADIYRLLKKNGVQNVASMRLGGDVEGLITTTQDYSTDPSRSRNLSVMVCHRLVLETVARALSTFGWAKVLFSCIADAVEASRQAYKAGILHRDISFGNVMIARNKHTGEWKGILLDWDMCILFDHRPPDPCLGRVGTRAFMSVNLSKTDATVTHTLADDLESYLWVIIYTALRFMHNGLNPRKLPVQFQSIFWRVDDSHSHRMGYLAMCGTGNSHIGLAKFQAPGVNEIMNYVGKVFFYKRYKSLERGTFTHINLDNPDDNWLVDFLRTEAAAMQPLNITPTGLKSPTNDSLPPVNTSEWVCASSTDAPFDFRHNNIDRIQRESVDLALTTRQINHLDGISDPPIPSSDIDSRTPKSPAAIHSEKPQQTSPGHTNIPSTSSSPGRSRVEYMKGRSPYLTPSPSTSPKRRYTERGEQVELTSPRSNKKHRTSLGPTEKVFEERIQDSVHLSTPSHSPTSSQPVSLHIPEAV